MFRLYVSVCFVNINYSNYTYTYLQLSIYLSIYIYIYIYIFIYPIAKVDNCEGLQHMVDSVGLSLEGLDRVQTPISFES